jgi:predicted ATPase/DNA-binding CsgD family transcriptional regulator/tetratricopeptide (TPR) repeat protein
MLPEGPLIGRESELLGLEQAVDSARLVTVTGAGGCGKTRVARELAGRIRTRFEPFDVVIVELATVRSAGHVVDAVLRALGARERAGRTPTEVVLDGLAGRRSMLLLDNCEHVADEVGRLVRWLLDAGAELRVLATSREPLGVAGELLFSLSPLCLPEAGGDVAAVVRSDAGRFFVDRAAAADPSFALTPSTARSVVRICRQLDGLPLALGLAAARVETLAPGEIADGLSRRGRLSGAPDGSLLPQHRSVRASLAWSYALLAEPERVLFRRLSAFGGGWDTAGARAVALSTASETEVGGWLLGLEEKGLIVRVPAGGPTRWSFLETVADYAAEQLALDAEEQEAVRDRQLAWFHAFAADSDDLLLTPGGHALIDQETPNLRLALDWAIEHDAGVALHMVGSLLRHWILGEHFEEGRAATARVLTAGAHVDDPAARALVHLGAALIGAVSEDYPAAVSNVQSGIAFLAAVDDPATQARCLQMSGMVLILAGVDLPEGLRSANRAVELLRASGDLLGLAWALVNVAMAEGVCDRFDAARTAYDEFLTIPSAAQHPRLRIWAELAGAWIELIVGSPARALQRADVALELEGRWPSMTHFILTGFRVHALALLGRADDAVAEGLQALANAQKSGAVMATPAIEMALAIAELMAGDGDRAEARARRLLAMPQVHTVALMREVLAQIALVRGDALEVEVHGRELATLAQQSDSPRYGAVADLIAGRGAVFQGDLSRGRDLAHHALATYAELGIERGAADALEELALIAASAGDGARTARLAAAAMSARARLACQPWPSSSDRVAAARARFVDRDGEAAWDVAWEEGDVMPLADAIAYARRSRGPRARPATGWPSLTPTELDVAQLAATGISNPQIAAQLFMARSTVKMHLASVYLKLGIANRTELARTSAMNGEASQPIIGLDRGPGAED